MAHTAYDHIKDTMEAVANTFPEALDFAQFMRKNQRVRWPRWCYLPHDIIRPFLAKTTSVTHLEFETVRLGGALSWWQHQAVYRFKTPLLQELVSRPEPKALLGESFVTKLPRWGGYVDLVATEHELLEGFWWHFDAVADYSMPPRWEPRLLLFRRIRGEAPEVMYLNMGTSLREAVRGWIQDGLERADKRAVTIPLEMGAVDGVVRRLTPLINILLYFMEEQTAFVPVDPPATKRPAAQVQVFDVA